MCWLYVGEVFGTHFYSWLYVGEVFGLERKTSGCMSVRCSETSVSSWLYVGEVFGESLVSSAETW